MTRKTSRLRAMERTREQRPTVFRGVFLALPMSLLLWWMLCEVVR